MSISSFVLGNLFAVDVSVAMNQPVPTWTDKEVLVAVGSTLATVIPICLVIIRMATYWALRSARQAKNEKAVVEKRLSDVEKQLETIRATTAPTKPGLEEMEQQLYAARQEAETLLKENATAKASATSLGKTAEHLKTNLENLQGNLTQYEEDLTKERRRIQKALHKDGQTWTEKVLANAPEFKPLDPEERPTPILSILNLKGGVGKTTIAANLGAALDRLGYRVLLLDLDLQGSLTALFLPDVEQERLFKAERLLSDFLAASFGAEFPSLLDFTEPILADQKSGLVPTTDGLAYAETNLTIRWLLREGNRDPRFLLRKELQLKRVTRKYDIVLMDCPPLINVCCVNALAASDYLLVPTLPSKQATDRVPVLLKRLKEFRENINPALKVMGVVANRTNRSDLTADEENRLSLLRVQCKDTWGEEVPQFETFIRQSAEIRSAEDQHRPLQQTEEMHQAFRDLAREVESRLPTFIRSAVRAHAPKQEAAS